MAYQSSNLIELLRQRVQQQPLQKAYTFLSDGEDQEVSLTYEQLDRRASAIAAWLQYLHAAGERVLLLYPPGLEYITAFWGCLYAGAVAVPAYPPRQNRSLTRLQSIAADAQSTIALTTSALLAKTDALTAQCPDLGKLRWLATDTVADKVADNWRRPTVNSDDLAFLQYTSGSTSTPKGVMVTHGNLLSNEQMIQEAFGQTEESTIVGWLPLYHDMGLIGNVLQPIYVGAQCVLMSPVSFLQNPYRWLAAITRYRATTSGGPNFAYDLCVRKITLEQRESLDLSSWEVAFNGAEPVRAASMAAFARTFESCGFRESAFRPCYGLAEATLLVSMHDSPLVKTVDAEALQNNVVADAPDGPSLVSCGPSPSGQKVHIYRPDTVTECLPGEVGEICVSGPNVTKGYWNRPEETARTFQSHHSEVLLRTGDLGVLVDGNLFVTGRIKDLIIIRGRNHYPHDIERTVGQSHAALRPGGGAAFSIEIDGDERLVIAHELNGRRQIDRDEIIRAINDAVAEEYELQVHAVVLLKTGSIPKTSSGKIQRHACREKFLTQSFDVVAEWKAVPQRHNEEQDVEAWLRAELAANRGVDVSTIDVNRPISEYALDSLEAIELTHRIEARLGVVLPMAALLQSPTIAEIAEQARAAAKTTVVAAPAQSEFPLSRGQQALWFLYQLAPESAAYNIATPIRIVSALDVAALRRAFQVLLDRHPSLRSVFSVSDGEPVQRVLDHAEISFEEIDASAWSESELNEQLIEKSRRRFDLEHGPALRVHLFSRGENDHVVLLVVHHIVADFWSLSVLTNELGIVYAAEVSGTQPDLNADNADYAAYVNRQQEMLAGSEGERLWSYWREQLAGELPVLDLATDHARPPLQTYNGASAAFKLSEDVTRGLKSLAQAHGATLYMTLLAAFQTLLFRYTGQNDLLVGSPTSGRNQNGLAGLVGFFVNPIVLRSNPSATTSFTSFLEQTKQTVLSAFAHQEYPFPLLVERLEPERDMSRSPLLQVMFIMQKAHLLNQEGLTGFALGEAGQRVTLGALELESVALEQRISQFDLTLVMAEDEHELSASLQYNTDLFEASTIERMAKHFQTLLQGIVARPRRRLSNLPLLTEAEQQKILFDWNYNSVPYPRELCLHQLFEAQAARTPSATALIHDRERVTYAELDARANQLAHHLRSLGVSREVFVGLLLQRRVEMVVALLAVLKAGGAYLALESNYPIERLQFMLQNTGAGILITEESLLGVADQIVESAPTTVMCLERERQLIEKLPATTLASSVLPQNMAYVIYTSGSTGVPKGVVINHSSAVLMAQWAGEYFTREQLAGVLASTSISFDLSVFELFAPLSTGGTVILAENALQLPELPTATEVTLVNTVPSAMAELVRSGSVPESVKTINLAGEALSRELVRQLYEVPTVESVINLYGPSEDTTYSTFASIDRDDAEAPAIGRPLPGTQAYVLDRAGRPVPTSVTGELHLGGEGLGRGYWNGPELTAERFVPDPFGNVSGGRLYRTGDLVRFCDDGTLEYLGRMDHQVKLRGFRIELGEIEEVLRRHERVTEAVVLVNEQRLLAYVVSEEQPAELRAWLRERLPEYMLPQAFVVLEELPLTPNGKVDRKALLGLEVPELDRQRASVEPRTETESAVAEMWREILRVGNPSVEDNFFEAGGHSLLATRLMSQVTKRFGVEVTLRSFFENATIEGLASQIDLATKSAQILKAPALTRIPRIGNPPLSFAQQRLWFLNQLEADNTAYNMPAALRLTGELNIDALEESLTEIIRRHEILRTTFVMEDGEPVQVIAPAQHLSIPVIELCDRPQNTHEAELRRLATAEAQRPFDLSRGPLLRLTLVRLADDEHVLLLTVHHIVFDGWSIGVFIQELTALYAAYNNGNDAAIPELLVQYADYAVWQREWLQGEVLEQQLSYWKQQLQNAPEALDLPLDKTRPAVRRANGASQSFELSTDLAQSLKNLAQQENATLFMVLLGAFQVLLSRYSGQTDVLVGAAVSNRNRAEIEGLIGFFVNMLVMRADLSGDPSFREYLARVREVALEAYAHQDLPFETLVESLQVGRSLDRTPLFQVAFVLENMPVAELELPGIKLTPVDVDTARAQFDLRLSMSETKDGRLSGSITYNTDLFHAATIERMQKHLHVLLQGIIAHPQQRLSELPLLTEAEERQVVFDWNQTAASYPQDVCIHQLFEQQVERSSGAIALVCGDDQVTYGELNGRANQLAHHLRKMGIRAEMPVGLCVERSIEMVVGLLGILKAGGAYLPLDPEYPVERLSLMMNDAQPSVVLTQKCLLPNLPAHRGQVICLDAEWELIAAESEENPPSYAVSDNLAYIMYTSGSTGVPKTVGVTHQNVVRLVMETDYANFGSEEVFLLLAPLAFDASTFELWGSLLHGSRLISMPQRSSLEEIGRALTDHNVTTLWLTAGLFHLMANEQLEALAGVRQVLAGGDVLSVSQVEKTLAAQDRLGLGSVFTNGYGPTETTTFACCYRLDSQAKRERVAESVPIGRPIANTDVHVLGEQMELLPIGVAGELYIGGAGVARGYLNSPELTAERFVPHPYSRQVGARLYRTGDLVRWLETGNIEFLGRRDQQVKIRGFRIELGEIKAVIGQHPQIREVVVLVRQDVEKRLIAYIVAEGSPLISDLRRYVAEKLPESMMPQAFIVVDEMPLTSNGKVDRRALLALGEPEFVRDKEILEPRTETERAVAEIWKEILRVDQVSLEDNFFDIGGHSLLATRVTSQVTKQFGVEIGLRRFFEEPTIEALANEIEIALKAEKKFAGPTIARASRERYRMNIPPQGQMSLPEGMR